MTIPPNKEIIRGLTVVVLFATGLLIGLWLLSKVYILLIYFAVAVMLSLIGRPIVDFIAQRRVGKFGIPRWLGALLVIGLFYSVLGGLLAGLIPMVAQQVKTLTSLDPEQIVSSLDEPIMHFERRLVEFGMTEGAVREGVQNLYNNLLALVSISGIFAGLVNILRSVGVAFFAITFSTFFLLKEKGLFSRAIIAATPDEQLVQVKEVMRSSKKLLRRYLVGLLGQWLVFTLVVTLGLSIVGVRYALLIALVGATMNIIPYAGPLLGGAFGVIIALTTYGDYGSMTFLLPLVIKVVVVFWIAQIIDNNVVGPTIFANVVHAHPLEIFMVVLSAGLMGGLPFMIMAIPGYTVLRIIAREFFWEFKVVQALTSRLGRANDDD